MVNLWSSRPCFTSRHGFTCVAKTHLPHARAISETVACNDGIIGSRRALLAIAHTIYIHTHTRLNCMRELVTSCNNGTMRANAFERNLTRFISRIAELYGANVMRGARTTLMLSNAVLRHASPRRCSCR